MDKGRRRLIARATEANGGHHRGGIVLDFVYLASCDFLARGLQENLRSSDILSGI